MLVRRTRLQTGFINDGSPLERAGKMKHIRWRLDKRTTNWNVWTLHTFIKLSEKTNPESWDLGCAHFPNSDQIIDEIPGGVALSVLLVGGVSHPNVVEAVDTDLHTGELRFKTNLWKSERKRSQTALAHLTHELLSVLVACSSDVVAGSQLLLSTPGIQEVLDVRHDGPTGGERPQLDVDQVLKEHGDKPERLQHDVKTLLSHCPRNSFRLFSQTFLKWF